MHSRVFFSRASEQNLPIRVSGKVRRYRSASTNQLEKNLARVRAARKRPGSFINPVGLLSPARDVRTSDMSAW